MAGLLGEIKDVMTLASSVINLGGTLYHASEALEEFKRNVVELGCTCDSWQSRAQRYGLSSDPILCSSLGKAKEHLQLEEARLKKLDRGCGCLWLWLCSSSRTNFPAGLGRTIVNLDNTITSKWKADDDAEDASRRRAEVLARSPPSPFKKDRRYVKIPIIEEELKSTLNNRDSGDKTVRVVLLYGRAGTGKSSMARNLALDYMQVAAFATNPCASNSASERQFDSVLYLECGPEADLKAKQMQLFGMLDWRSSDAEKHKYKDYENVKPILKQLLKDSRSLIIFDDVWEELFLKDMVGVCGERMKILVTSQKKGLCAASLCEKTTSISMDQITRADSLRILKVHTGFDDQERIPEAVEKCMEDLVTKVCGHPHALASIAVAIDTMHKNQVSQWQNAIREYDQLLDDPLSISVVNPVHDVQYERSFIEAIQMKFRRLDEEETKLLVLMVMLKGPLIAEEVLQLFHAELIAKEKSQDIRSCRAFFNARKKLENLQCIKTSDYKQEYCLYPWDCGRSEQCTGWWRLKIEGLVWSIHSLDQQFIRRRMENDIVAMLELVQHLPSKVQGLKTEPQENAIKLLASMLFSSPLKKKVPLQFRLPTWNSCILPIIYLMVKNVGEGWNKNSQRSSEQILLSCITKRVIHNDAAKELLNSSMSKHELWSLMRYFKHWSASMILHEDVIVGVLRIFGDLKLPMDSSVVGSLNPEQWNALLVLVSRPSLRPARSCIFQMRKLVLGLFDMLTSPPRNVKHLSAVVLRYLVPLMYTRRSDYGEEGLTTIPTIIQVLVHGLEENSDRKIVEEATRALYALACDSKFDVLQKMTNIGLHQLRGNFAREKDLILRGLAFDTLCKLEHSQEPYPAGVSFPFSTSVFKILTTTLKTKQAKP